MKLYEFLLLDEQKQYQSVWDQGTFINQVVTTELTFMLYSINDFYVEIHYDRGLNKVVGKQPFKQGVYLEKYLNPIPKIL